MASHRGRPVSLLASGALPRWVAPILVWVLAASGLLASFIWMQSAHPDLLFEGFKLRDGSSDNEWQTLRLWELWKVGPSALWLSHIYPPLYDGIRWLLMQPEVLNGQSPSALDVDHRLFVFNAILFGFVAMIVYLWVRDLTRNGWWAAFGALAWCLLPASYAYMTLLNQTGLAIAAMAAAWYLLYRFCRTRRNVYAIGFLAALLVASLTRNVVQIHVFVVVLVAAVCFYFMGRPRSLRALVVSLFLVALIAFWPARAWVMYSTFDVSTHTGYNRAGALWINPNTVPEPAWPDNITANATLLSSGWNTQETLKDNYRLGAAANELMLHHPVEAGQRLLKSLTITMPVAFRSIYVQWYNAFLYASPLAPPLDWIFSGLRFVGLIVLSFAVVFVTAGWRGSRRILRQYLWFIVFWVLVAIPVAFSNRYWPPEVPEPVHSEADRLRALIDVPVYVVMVLAASIVVRRSAEAIRRRRRGGAEILPESERSAPRAS
ncbi:MAG: hypothetical protein IPO93_08005 [Actinobacteria bacterium]|nr:hypothetical protein [Actinomycetota bacterium]